MRATSDKSLRLVLSTFKNLREELCHLQDDLGVSPVLPSHGSSSCSQLEAGARAGIPGCGCAGGSGYSQCLGRAGWTQVLWQLQRFSGLQPSQPWGCGWRHQTIPVGEAAMFPTSAQVLSTAGNVTALSWKMKIEGEGVWPWAQNKESV